MTSIILAITYAPHFWIFLLQTIKKRTLSLYLLQRVVVLEAGKVGTTGRLRQLRKR